MELGEAASSGAVGPDVPLRGLGEVTSEVTRGFEEHGVLGVMLIDASVLGGIERKHGDAARMKVLRGLGELVSELAGERLSDDDLVVAGEVGRSELLVLFFREPGNAACYRTEMPGFGQSIQRVLERQAARVFYPYLRSAPKIWIGTSVALRNPRYAVETQLRQLVLEAREDAELQSRLEAQRRRRSFIELLLDGSVYSVYEPIVEVSSRTVFGYEALARGPEGTPLHSPLALFGEAGKLDLVFELDCLCRRSGLKGAIDFPGDVKLFLNILPTTLHDPGFNADQLVETLDECQLSPRDVVLEISEQESIENFAAFREMSDQYRRLGFEFALDDTGSGYAGLEELIELQPEFIKIDRSMVSGVDQDLTRQEVLSALLGVAKRTGAKVIGEGLDTLEELAMLGELGIHFGQGWLFGRPTPLRARED